MIEREPVDLTYQERGAFPGAPSSGVEGVDPARALSRARTLPAVDRHGTDTAIADALHVHPTTAERIRRRFADVRAAMRRAP